MRVLVVNAYSPLNRGDAAILDGLIATLRACGAHRVIVPDTHVASKVSRRPTVDADTVPTTCPACSQDGQRSGARD